MCCRDSFLHIYLGWSQRSLAKCCGHIGKCDYSCPAMLAHGFISAVSVTVSDCQFVAAAPVSMYMSFFTLAFPRLFFLSCISIFMSSLAINSLQQHLSGYLLSEITNMLLISYLILFYFLPICLQMSISFPCFLSPISFFFILIQSFSKLITW